MKSAPRVSNQWFHISDWLYTFADIVGLEVPKYSEIDGISQLKALQEENILARDSLLINIDEIDNYAAYIENGWKVVQGTTADGKYDDYFGVINNPKEKMISEFQYTQMVQNSEVGVSLGLKNSSIIKQRSEAILNCKDEGKRKDCQSSKYPCLFDIIRDPCEYYNIARFQPRILKEMLTKMSTFSVNSVPPRNIDYDENVDPVNFNNTWTWWIDGSTEGIKKF